MRSIFPFRPAAAPAVLLILAACGESPQQDDAGLAKGDETPAANALLDTTGDSSADAAEAQLDAEPANSVARDKADSSVIVECNVASAPGDLSYEGECDFIRLGGHSFTLRRIDSQPFFEQIIEIIIEADTPTQAGLSVRLTDGERPGFGTAIRDSAADECWINDSLDVCVQGL